MGSPDWDKLDLGNLDLAPIRWRERFFAFTPADTTAYVRLLTEAFPTLRFYDEWNMGERRSSCPAPPATRWLDAEMMANVSCAMPVFQPDWEPSWERARDGSWRFTAPSPRPYGRFYPSTLQEPDKRGPRFIGEGRFNIGYTPGNKEQASIAGKAMRLIAKVATNRYQAVAWPSYDVLKRSEQGGIFWIGHDAVRWARESPDRLLWYGHGRGLRPLD